MVRVKKKMEGHCRSDDSNELVDKDYSQDDIYFQRTSKYPTAVKVWRNKSRRYKQQYNTKMRAIIFHYGLFKIIWDWFVLLLVLYTAIEVPFLVCFINNKGNPLTEKSGLNNLIVVDICVDMFFFCDIIVNFRTTYIEKNDALITNPKMIAIRYLRTYFIVDLVAAVPWDLIYLNQTTRESTSLSLLKTVRLLRLFQAARRLDQNYEKSVSLLFLMVFVFTLVAHWLACIWYYIGLSEARVDSPTWLSMLADQIRQPFNGSDLTTGPSLRSRYLTSLYFTLTCITSVGFGNVSPNTDWEKLFTIISMLIGGLLFAAVFGNVSAIIYGHYSGTFKFRERMQSVKYFLAYHKIKGPLALKVKDYSRHLWTQTKGISTAKVMKQFPQSLQEEINSYLHFNVIRDCPLFEHAEESCLWSLAVRMVQLNHLPNNTIVRQGTVVNSVYIIKRGRLDVLRNGAVVGKIGEGVAFGNLSIELHGPVPKSAVTLRSNTFVDIHILHLKDLKELLELYPEFKQELIRKTTTILKKTVLTSQILSSWDALEVENSGARSNGLTFVSTWITRQKSKRNCNVTKSKEHGYVSRKKKHINETLVNLPLVVLSPMCASNDDAQQYWRFANIIESRDNENGESSEENSVSKKHNCVNEEKDTLVESTVSADEKQYLSAEESEVCEGEKEYLETNIDDVVNLHNCDSKDSHCMNNDDTKYEKLELSVQDICKKLETLERKMDLILNYLENQTQTTVV